MFSDICGSYNKYWGKACSDRHIIESNLIIAILNDIEELTSYVEEQDIITNIESKVRELNLQLQTQLNSVNKEIQNINHKKQLLFDCWLMEFFLKKITGKYCNKMKIL